jgi:hypothetical protein
MKAVLAFIISQSILFPVIIGFVRFRTIKTDYQPFFWSLVFGFLTEIISFNLIHFNHAGNAVPTNIFVLGQWLLLCYQFQVWGFLRKQKGLLLILTIVPVLVWFSENIFFGKIGVLSPYFQLLYAFLITLMSITEINFCITHDHSNLLKNPTFIICIGLILFFVYQMLYEWSYQMSIMHEPSQFTQMINASFAYINAFTNIIFGIAFLVIAGKKQYGFEI